MCAWLERIAALPGYVPPGYGRTGTDAHREHLLLAAQREELLDRGCRPAGEGARDHIGEDVRGGGAKVGLALGYA